MSQHLFNDTDITAIANAIRTKKGSSNTMTITQMPAEIESIPSGGSTDPVAVRFLDFDGTVVQELNDNGLNGLIALPEAPDHSHDDIPLVFDEWNWLLSEIKAFRTANPTWTVNVGANYHTADGKMHVLVDTPADGTVTVLNYAQSNVKVNWGDGSSNLMGNVGITKTYTYADKYHITIEDPNSTTGVDFPIGLTSYQYFTTDIRCGSNIYFEGGSNGYDSLKTISLPARYINIAFSSARELQWFTMPRQSNPSITTIMKFNYCGVKYQPMIYGLMGVYGFEATNCPNLEEIYIKSHYRNSVIANNNASVKRIYIENNSVPLLNNAFEEDTALEEVNLPTGLTSIPKSTFDYCFNLKRVTIPNTVTSIESAAFRRCRSLEPLTIPASVTSIGTNAFAYSGVTLIMKGTTPPTLGNSSVLNYINYALVPYSSNHSVLNAYKTAQYWSNNASKIFESPAE